MRNICSDYVIARRLTVFSPTGGASGRLQRTATGSLAVVEPQLFLQRHADVSSGDILRRFMLRSSQSARAARDEVTITAVVGCATVVWEGHRGWRVWESSAG